MQNDPSKEIIKMNVVPEVLSDGTAESPKITLTRPEEYYFMDDLEKEMYVLPKAKNYTNTKNNKKTLTRNKVKNAEKLQCLNALSPKMAETNPNMIIKNPNNIKFSDMMDKFTFQD